MGVKPRRQGSYLALVPKDCQTLLDWLQGCRAQLVFPWGRTR